MKGNEHQRADLHYGFFLIEKFVGQKNKKAKIWVEPVGTKKKESVVLATSQE